MRYNSNQIEKNIKSTTIEIIAYIFFSSGFFDIYIKYSSGSWFGLFTKSDW